MDEDFIRKLSGKSRFIQNAPQVFSKEHSLEVQIPFLQKVFKQFKIVPLVMGQPSYEVCESLAQALSEVIADRDDVLVIASTDLSHYHDYSFANAMDQNTVQTIVENQPQKLWSKCMSREMEMCGFQPTVTALLYAQKKGLQKGELLKYANSGDVTGEKDRVVGYSSVIFYDDKERQNTIATEGVSPLSQQQKKRLIQIARETVEAFVRTGNVSQIKETDNRLRAIEGAFVTLHKHGQLRGCIGNIIGQQPLYLTVRDMAVAAAAHDPRFKPVKTDELKDIEVEVSVLSKPRVISNADEIVMGKHGVIVSRGMRSGIYLPQVATETGWSREQFLSSLCAHKAGLSEDAWKDPKTRIEIFTAEVFSEKDILLPPKIAN